MRLSHRLPDISKSEFRARLQGSRGHSGSQFAVDLLDFLVLVFVVFNPSASHSLSYT